MRMSTSKVLLLAIACAVGLFFLTAVLTVTLNSTWPIFIIMLSAPLTAGVVAGMRAGRSDSKFWVMLSVAGCIAPFAWIVLMAASGV